MRCWHNGLGQLFGVAGFGLVCLAVASLVGTRCTAAPCYEGAALDALLDGHTQRAQALYRALESADPTHARDWRNNQALCALDAGDFDEAGRELGALLAEGYWHAEVGLGLVARAEGDLEQARVCLSGSAALEELGFVLYALGRFDEAAGAFGQVASASGDPLHYYNLCAALEAAGGNVDVSQPVSLAQPGDGVHRLLLLGRADEAEANGKHREAEQLRAHASEFESDPVVEIR